MFTFATDYYILVFVATIGIIQVAASFGRLNGLLFIKSPIVTRVLGIALAAAAFIWFFSTGDRNINDYEGGLDAPTQSLFFFLGSATGFVFTFVVSTLVNARMNGEEPSPEEGLDALRDTNYLRALLQSISYWRREWRTQMKRYFSG